MKFRLLRIPFEAQLWFFVMLIFLNLQRLDGFSGYPLFATVIFIEGMAMVAVSVICLLYTSPSPRDGLLSRMPSSA